MTTPNTPAQMAAGAFFDQVHGYGDPVEKAAPGITNDDIRREFLAAGFTIKEGMTDLKPYVYEAARRILALAAQQAAQPVAQCSPTLTECQRCKNDFRRCPMGAQPVAGEPVAPYGWLIGWPQMGGGRNWLWHGGHEKPTHIDFPMMPLYTAAPAPVGLVPLTLTDEQCEIAIKQAGLSYLCVSAQNRAMLMGLCRAAHGIKAGKDCEK